MAPLPTLTSPTVRAIYQAYEDDNESWDSWGLSVGELGNECDRSLYCTLHWASPQEVVDGRKVRIFRRGDIEEERLIEDLERIGVEVFGQQGRIRLVAGHVRGKIDGRLLGVLEAPKTEHLFEAKSANGANWRALAKDKVRKAQPKHYVQCQLGMHALGLTRAFYVSTNKDTEEIHAERLEYDFEFCARLLARAQRIIEAQEPPPRISEKPDFFGCRFCRHKPLCHQVDTDGPAPEPVFARVNCRTCFFSQPTLDGDCAWQCGRFAKPLSIDEQREGCPAQLFVPGLVPGEQTDADEEAETITYRLADGTVWVDGAGDPMPMGRDIALSAPPP